jgi:PKD repeat protein
MQPKLGGIFRLIGCVLAVVMLAIPAWAGSEVYVVSANASGDANYALLQADGSFADMEILQLSESSGITTDFLFSRGNALGDFDNDGDYDYLLGIGYGGGDIYIFEKLGDGNQFGAPVNVASWDQGFIPMDLAVADFDGDGNQDFVMSYMYSTIPGLYLGDGNFGFTYIPLENNPTSYYSAGTDAADFNGDGLPDFVVVSNSTEEPIYVYLNQGNGTFTTVSFNTCDGNGAWGVAAADFTGEGNADIATAYHDSLIIYQGDGKGGFQCLAVHDAFDLNLSALDNYDFDGDGKQDLVAANFGTVTDGIAVLLGDGKGNFALDATYSSGAGAGVDAYQDAVSAPPYQPPPNVEPVAVLEPGFLEVTAGEAIEFDGSQSYDDDGEIAGYQWDFGDGNMVTEGGAAVQTHSYSEVGQYFVTLTVTDDQGAAASVQAEVQVSAAPAAVVVPVKVAFSPHELKHKRRDKWFKATIRVPSDYDARQIDIASVHLVIDDEIVLTAATSTKHDYFKKLFKRLFKKHRSRHTLSVKFKREDVSDALDGASGRTVLKVAGKMLKDGQLVDFAGAGTIKVSGKHGRKAHHGKKHAKK